MKAKNILAGAIIAALFSACVNSNIQKGNRYYDSLSYSKAIPPHTKAFNKAPNYDLGNKLADSYYRTGKLDESAAVYEKVLGMNSDGTLHFFKYARVLMANGEYEKAKMMLNKYLAQNEDDAVALMLLSSCNSIADRYVDTSLFSVNAIPMSGFANAFSVTEYQEGIVFVGDKEVFKGKKMNPWTGNSYLDMYEMKKDEEGTWMAPELFRGDVNGRFHEGPATFSKDGSTVYFTRSNYFKRKLEVNKELENNLKIFKATLVDEVWRNLEEFPLNNDDYSVGHPTLSFDGQTMYFVSDMPGGFGGTDLYKAILVDGKWCNSENLGETINTAGNEVFPYCDKDGTLYFSSDAHNSMGGLDVFLTYHNGSRWMAPENLNYPVNSNKDDFGFVLNPENNTGFVSSSRNKTDKIYEVSKNQAKFNLIGFAHEKGSQIPVEGVLALITNSQDNKVDSLYSDIKGGFKMKLRPETDYDILCTKEGCFSRTDQISTKGYKYSQDFYADFIVERIEINKPIVLENIYYDFDKWNIRADAGLELDKLLKLLLDNPMIEIEMGSHTDSRGSDKYNQVLSNKRAHAAVMYLIFAGVEAKRLTWMGYGESALVNECKNNVVCSDEKHQENRRTEFKVTKINTQFNSQSMIQK